MKGNLRRAGKSEERSPAPAPAGFHRRCGPKAVRAAGGGRDALLRRTRVAAPPLAARRAREGEAAEAQRGRPGHGRQARRRQARPAAAHLRPRGHDGLGQEPADARAFGPAEGGGDPFRGGRRLHGAQGAHGRRAGARTSAEPRLRDRRRQGHAKLRRARHLSGAQPSARTTPGFAGPRSGQRDRGLAPSSTGSPCGVASAASRQASRSAASSPAPAAFSSISRSSAASQWRQ